MELFRLFMDFFKTFWNFLKVIRLFGLFRTFVDPFLTFWTFCSWSKPTMRWSVVKYRNTEYFFSSPWLPWWHFCHCFFQAAASTQRVALPGKKSKTLGCRDRVNLKLYLFREYFGMYLNTFRYFSELFALDSSFLLFLGLNLTL